MKRVFTCFLLLMLATPTFAADKRSTIKDILKDAKQGPAVGMISECNLDGKQIFSVDYNAYDYGGKNFTEDGKPILMNCNVAWGGTPDPACTRVTDCKRVYVAQKNIYGEKPMDLYKADSWLP